MGASFTAYNFSAAADLSLFVKVFAVLKTLYRVSPKKVYRFVFLGKKKTRHYRTLLLHPNVALAV